MQRGGHDDPRVPDGDGGVGDGEVVEHDPGGGHADGPDERDAHGFLDVRHAQRRERLGGAGHEKVLGEVQARLGDDGGDVRRRGLHGCGGGGGEEQESDGDKEELEERGAHGGEEARLGFKEVVMVMVMGAGVA